jgi:hypothetical protein
MSDKLRFNTDISLEVRIAATQPPGSSGNGSAAWRYTEQNLKEGLAAEQRCDQGPRNTSRPRIQCTECGADRELLRVIAWEFDQERYPCCDPVPIEERHAQNSRIEQRCEWEEFSL